MLTKPVDSVDVLTNFYKNYVVDENNDLFITTCPSTTQLYKTTTYKPNTHTVTIKYDPQSGGFTYSSDYNNFSSKIKKVIFNPPATIIIWNTGEKTVVQTRGNETFDPEKGFVMAYLKYLLGNDNTFNKEIHRWVKEEDNV